MIKAPGHFTNHWHVTLAELRELETTTRAAGKRLGHAGVHGVFDQAVKTLQLVHPHTGLGTGACYRVFALRDQRHQRHQTVS